MVKQYLKRSFKIKGWLVLILAVERNFFPMGKPLVFWKIIPLNSSYMLSSKIDNWEQLPDLNKYMCVICMIYCTFQSHKKYRLCLGCDTFQLYINHWDIKFYFALITRETCIFHVIMFLERWKPTPWHTIGQWLLCGNREFDVHIVF